MTETEPLCHDLEAYAEQPLSEDELAIAAMPVTFDLDDHEVDYEVTYGIKPGNDLLGDSA